MPLSAATTHRDNEEIAYIALASVFKSFYVMLKERRISLALTGQQADKLQVVIHFLNRTWKGVANFPGSCFLVAVYLLVWQVHG